MNNGSQFLESILWLDGIHDPRVRWKTDERSVMYVKRLYLT